MPLNQRKRSPKNEEDFSMNFIQKLIILGFLLGGSLIAMQSDKVYYSRSKLKVLDTQGKQKHAPVSILIDEQNDERIEGTNIAITKLLVYKIKRYPDAYPIITSAHLFKNLLLRTKDPSRTKNETDLELSKIIGEKEITSEEWDIYDIPQSQFVLLMPKYFVEIYGKNLGFKKLPDMTNLLPTDEAISISTTQKINPYKKIIDWIEQNKKLTPFSAKDFDQVFMSKSESIAPPLWDFFIIGHGTTQPPLIANLSPNSFNSMLSFFDSKIKTGTIYVVSCMAGGKNRTLLETTKDGVQISHNYIFILGAISDSIVKTQGEYLDQVTHDFFNYAAFVQDRGESVSALLKKLIYFYPTVETPHGATALPQIWFPGGFGFQTLNIVDSILSLGNVFLRIHQEENKPIIIDKQRVVLLYPSTINATLEVIPVRQAEAYYKPWKDLLFVFEPTFFKDTDEQTKQTVIDQLKKEGVLPSFLEQLPGLAIAQSDANPNYYIYPEFISMQTGESKKHSISKIKVGTKIAGSEVAQGVLQFIREAFFDIGPKEGSFTFFIDEITGINDLSLTLAASRILSNIKEKHPLEEVLKDRINKEITLKNVMLLFDKQSISTLITFQIDNTAWLYMDDFFSKDPRKEMRWNFKEVNNSAAEQSYKDLKAKIETPGAPSQKSISEILKQKHAEIPLKKAVEAKRKEAAESAVKKYKEAAIATKPAQEEPKK